jgi:hypothetical protein
VRRCGQPGQPQAPPIPTPRSALLTPSEAACTLRHDHTKSIVLQPIYSSCKSDTVELVSTDFVTRWSFLSNWHFSWAIAFRARQRQSYHLPGVTAVETESHKWRAAATRKCGRVLSNMRKTLAELGCEMRGCLWLSFCIS